MTKARELAELGTTLSVDGSGNADLAGILTTDGLTVSTSSAVTASFARDGSDGDVVQIYNGAAGTTKALGIGVSGTHGTINSQYGGVYIQPSGTTSAFFGTGGDISFYEDTGTTAKLFWDASAEALGIGTSSPTNVKLQLNGSLSGTAGTGHLAFGEASTPLWNWRLDTTTADLMLDRSYGGWQTTPVIAFDRSSGNVGIGTSSPTTPTHITKGALSGFISRTAATLTLENSGDTELYLASSPTNTGQIRFGDTGGNFRGAISYDHTSDAFLHYTGGTERLRIDASGNVGIGTSSPATKLEVNSGSANEVAQFISTDGTAYLSIKDSGTTSDLNGIGTIGDTLVMWGGGSERMRIDSSGNVLVGTTTSKSKLLSVAGDSSTPIVHFEQISGGNSTTGALALNRQNLDGVLLDLRKGGTTVGSISARNGDLVIGTGDLGLKFVDSGNRIGPVNSTTGADLDGTDDLGGSTNRFKDLYLSGGVYLGGTGAANLLDDYEEGTWTPSITAGGSGSYTAAGEYTKIGNIVIAVFNVQFSSWSGNTSSVQITLPFAPLNPLASSHAGSATIGAYGGVSSYYPLLGGWVPDNATHLFLLGSNGTNDRTIKGTDLSSQFYVYATVTYRTSA